MKKVIFLQLVAGLSLLTGCTKAVLVKREFHNPCPDFPDLLSPIEERFEGSGDIDYDRELERELCLQEWVKKYKQ